MATGSDTEIIVKLTAETAQLQAGMDAGAASVTKATEEMQATIAQEAAAFNAAVQTKIDAQVRLNAAFAGGITSTAGVAEAEAALDQAMATGAVTAAEYATYVGRLDASEIELAASTAASTVAVDANTAAITLNSRAAAEVGVLMGELASGNASRMKRSFAALANQTGLLQKAVTFLFSPMGLLSVAIAGVAYEVFEAGQKFDEMEGTVLATGGAAGYTAGQLIYMANQIGGADGKISTAREALQQLAASGRFAGNDLRLAGQAATDMATLTGQSVQSMVGQIEKLQEDPVKAVAKLNDQYHFLNIAQFKEIEAAQQSGDAMKAASIAYEALADKMHSRTVQMTGDMNVIVKAWHNLGNAFTIGMQNMNVALGGGDVAAKLAAAQNALRDMQQTGQIGGIQVTTGMLREATDRVVKLTAELNQSTEATRRIGSAAQDTAAQIDAMAKGHGGKSGSAGGLEKTLQEQEAAQKISYDHRAQFEMIYWGDILQTAKSGSAEYTLAWKNVQTLQKQLDETQLAEWKKNQSETASAAHKAASEAMSANRKVAQETMTGLEMQRMGTLANTAERIQADAAILASATKLYGAMSSQQASALRQMLADEKSYAASYIKIQEDMEKQIEADWAKNNKAVEKASADAAKQATAAWKGYLDPVNHAFQTTINGMIQGTQTFRQSMQHLLQSIEASFIEYGIKDLEHYIITQQAKSAAAAAGAAERATIEAGAAVQSKALDASTGKSQITSAAATGAAKAYQAIVGIPFVGPVLAPIAAGVAFAGIEAFSGMISSAQGGWGRVPMDGMMTELHKDEMVLPAHIANPVRDMAARGGSGGGMTVNLSSTDPRGFKEYLRRNPSALSDALKHAHKRGHFAGAMR